MNSTVDLLRPEIRNLRPYRPADYVGGFVRLNANELPWRPPSDSTRDGLNRYPDPRPAELTERLTAHYGVKAGELLVTRGSSEGIDVLIRAFCRAGQDDIVICPPTFGMYEVYAQIQGAGVRRFALQRSRGFAWPVGDLIEGWTAASKLLFICSPNNPTGNAIPPGDLEKLCNALQGRGVVVLDAAYAEFGDEGRLPELLAGHENLVVLRTLSKALGLAGVRCGALIGRSGLVDLLGRVLPPYCFPTTSQEAVLGVMEGSRAEVLGAHRATLIMERERLSAELKQVEAIRRVWPSAANFILVESDDAAGLVAKARQAGILLRDFSWDADLPGSIRITVGSPQENLLLLNALRS